MKNNSEKIIKLNTNFENQMKPRPGQVWIYDKTRYLITKKNEQFYAVDLNNFRVIYSTYHSNKLFPGNAIYVCTLEI